MDMIDSKMQIPRVVYSPEIFCWQRYGGISRYFSELIPEVRSAGWSVEIRAGFHSNVFLDQIRNTSPVYGREIFVHEMIGKLGRTLLLLTNSLAFNLKDYHNVVIHQTYYSPFARRNERLIVTVHDLIHEKLKTVHQGIGSKIARRRSIYAAEKVIAISEATRNDLLYYYDISPDRVEVIHHGAHLAQIPPRHDDKIDASPPYLLFVGVRSGYKNFEKFVQAFAASAPLSSTYRLVCFGGGKFSSEELSLFSKLKLRKSIYWLEGNDSLLASYYRKATMLVYPSIYEGFGLPVLEAMANGCPVACSKTSSLPEVGGDAVYYFNPDDIDSIRDTIERAVSDDRNLFLMAQNGYQRAKSFSWQETARKTINVYRQVLEGSVK
jgi:glycosyltransferase involved in cell wall biosynthesis